MKAVKKQSPPKKVQKPKDTLFQLKVTLLDAPLPIWRRVVVRAEAPLLLVHEILQIAMGWWNYQRYEFQAKGKRYGDIRATDHAAGLQDDTQFALSDLLENIGDKFVYHYDSGDDWKHEVVLEHTLQADKIQLATCIVGRRACPPESVGGVEGYRQFLEIIEDPQDAARIEHLEWVGGDFDPNSFDLRGVNLRLLELEEELHNGAEA